MAFSTKGWRRIVIEGEVFYWQRHWSTGWQLFRARPEREAHRLLIATRGECGAHPVGFSDPISPQLVRSCVESGIQAGWLSEPPQLRQVVFSNPLRWITINPSWLTPTVLAIAQQMYDTRDFGAMPILADALQDAGCDNDDILNHCRGPGPHVRGCWVVDLVLGKT